MSVQARYGDYTGSDPKPSAISFGAMFLQAFGIPTTGEGSIDPALFENGGGSIATQNDNNLGGAYAYINYIFYDKDFNDAPLAGFARTTAAAENSFEALSLSFTAEKEGYLFVYVSNEEPLAKEVYFDDFRIVHTPSVVVQTDSYYPFGLSHGNISYVREGKAKNQFLYNGKELVEGFDLGWFDYGARYYAPDLGRWHVVDPLAEKYVGYSPYNYVLNNPIIFIDPDGRGVNGGFSITNRSDETIKLQGTSLTVRKGTNVPDDEQWVESANTELCLSPEQRYEATFTSSTLIDEEGQEFTVNFYSGRVVDIENGDIVQENAGIYDVDRIIVEDDQVFELSNGDKSNSKQNVKLGSSFMDAALQNGLDKIGIHYPPDEDDRNEGNVEITNGENGTIKVETTGEFENQPNPKLEKK